MAANERLLSMQEVRVRLRRSENILRITRVVYIIFDITGIIGLLLLISPATRDVGTKLSIISAALLAIASLLRVVTTNQTLRSCGNCHTVIPAPELLSAPDSYCCPHCGKPFQAKINTEEFSF